MDILAAIWMIAALVALLPVTSLLKGAFPIFTVVWLGVPLIALLRERDVRGIGLQPIGWRPFLIYTALNLAGSLALTAICEPWSHTYQMLLHKALSSNSPDTTFGWLVRFPGIPGWAGFVCYAGLVTLFGEELFFRGWLLQLFQGRMSAGKAIAFQAILFTLPQLLAAFLLPPLQGMLYATVYSFLAIGLIGGWAASRTQSIWPSLASATFYNLLMCLLAI